VKIGPIEVFDGTPVVDIKSASTGRTDERCGDSLRNASA
jgi:tRNA (Thr-GGU) A37 N-methylase